MGVKSGRDLFANRRQLDPQLPGWNQRQEGSVLDRKAAREGFTTTEPGAARGTELFNHIHPHRAHQKDTQ